MVLGDPVNDSYVKGLRMLRDSLLKNSDWLLTHDNALSLANLDEWMKYRQDLRNFFSDLNKPIIFQGTSSTWDIYAMGFPKEPKIIRKSNL